MRGDARWVDDHVRRAVDKGYDAFCLTVDTDSYSRRERDIASAAGCASTTPVSPT